MSRRLMLTAVAVLLLLGGCLELTETITLNPDGSGKALIDLYAPTEMPIRILPDANTKKPEPQEVARDFAQQQITDGEGVVAWSDVSVEATKDGKSHFRGTAYFADISAFKLRAGSTNPPAWTKEGSTMKLEIKQEQQEKPEPGPKLDDAAAKKKVAEQQEQYRKDRQQAESLFGTLRLQIDYVLPGKVTQTSIFQKTANGVELLIDGKKLLAAADELMKDEPTLLAAAKEGKDVTQGSDLMMQKVFGGTGSATATVTDVKPLFDYKSEAAQAQAQQAAMLKKLGLTAPAAMEK